MKRNIFMRIVVVIVMIVLLGCTACGCGKASKKENHLQSILDSNKNDADDDSVQSGGNGVAIRSYDAHSRMICAVDEENRLWFWGPMYRENLHDDCYVPRVVMEDVAEIDAGWEAIIILKTDGSVWYWDEQNDIADLVTSEGQREFAPEMIYDNAAKVCMDTSQPMFITGDGTLMAYEDGEIREIMSGVADASDGSNHMLILTEAGDVYAMGSNDFGQLGLGYVSNEKVREPQLLTNDAKGIFAGTGMSFVIKNDDSLWACGINHICQLSMDSTEPIPALIHLMDNVKSVSAFGNDLPGILMVTTDRKLYGRGYNITNLDTNKYGTPMVSVPEGTWKGEIFDGNALFTDGVVSAICADGYGLMMKEDGMLYSWGMSNMGQTGYGTADYYDFVTPIFDGSRADGETTEGNVSGEEMTDSENTGGEVFAEPVEEITMENITEAQAQRIQQLGSYVECLTQTRGTFYSRDELTAADRLLCVRSYLIAIGRLTAENSVVTLTAAEANDIMIEIMGAAVKDDGGVYNSSAAPEGDQFVFCYSTPDSPDFRDAYFLEIFDDMDGDAKTNRVYIRVYRSDDPEDYYDMEMSILVRSAQDILVTGIVGTSY